MRTMTDLPENPHLSDVLKKYPETWPDLLFYHDALLRAPGVFEIWQRELIAAYTSMLNQCDFCFGAHKVIAEAFGVSDTLLEQLGTDIDSSKLDDNMKPVLKFVKQLTLQPSKMTDKLRQDIVSAGWSQQAIHDASCICGLFSMMNRIIEGTGVTTNMSVQQDQKNRNGNKEPGPTDYRDFGVYCGIVDAEGQRKL